MYSILKASRPVPSLNPTLRHDTDRATVTVAITTDITTQHTHTPTQQPEALGHHKGDTLTHRTLKLDQTHTHACTHTHAHTHRRAHTHARTHAHTHTAGHSLPHMLCLPNTC